MSRWIKVSMAVLLLLAFAPLTPVFAQSNLDCDYYGTHSNGAVYCITLPTMWPMWNGDLVIFAHGYVPVGAPLDIPWGQMMFFNELTGQPTTLPVELNNMGFAFATTSYSENGLAVKQGIEDVKNLVNVFTEQIGMPPNRVFLVGASEGGLITTLAIEKYPDVFNGGLAACGPIGSFQGQVNYWGDFRTLFDYFMDAPEMDVLPGNSVNIPKALMSKWDSVYVPKVGSVMAYNPAGIGQVMAVSGAPFVPEIPATIPRSVGEILWYNVFATNDAVNKLGGNPYDNTSRVYSGSYNDQMLNAGVKRYHAKDAALAEIASSYETSGVLTRPLVTMHTTGDPVVPVWHQALYTSKVVGNNPYSPYYPMTIPAYGHCAFTWTQMADGFEALIMMASLPMP